MCVHYAHRGPQVGASTNECPWPHCAHLPARDESTISGGWLATAPQPVPRRAQGMFKPEVRPLCASCPQCVHSPCFCRVHAPQVSTGPVPPACPRRAARTELGRAGLRVLYSPYRTRRSARSLRNLLLCSGHHACRAAYNPLSVHLTSCFVWEKGATHLWIQHAIYQPREKLRLVRAKLPAYNRFISPGEIFISSSEGSNNQPGGRPLLIRSKDQTSCRAARLTTILSQTRVL